MKKILYIIAVISLLFLTSCGQNNKSTSESAISNVVASNPNDVVAYKEIDTQQGSMYRDLGYYNYNYQDGTYLKVHAYVWKQPNRTGYYPQYKYEYVLTAVSESWNGTRVAETWLYNNRIYYNSQEISYNQFPNGLTTYVQTSPTSVYSWFTSDENIGTFGMHWGSAIYENR